MSAAVKAECNNCRTEYLPDTIGGLCLCGGIITPNFSTRPDRDQVLEEAAKVAERRVAICDDAVKLIDEGKLYRGLDGAAATERCASLEARYIAAAIRALKSTGAA